MFDDPSARIPVVLLTGFLGAGKTTLLNRVLRAAPERRTLVLINEYGDVGIDHHLVADLPGDHVLLPAGCVCCSMRSDLLAALYDAHAARTQGDLPPFERVILETTGVADPTSLVACLGPSSPLSTRFRLARIITCVDVTHIEAQLADCAEAATQIAAADAVVLTKLGGAPVPEAVLDVVGALQPEALLLGAEADDTLLEALFRADGGVEASVHDIDQRLRAVRPARRPHSHAYRAYAFSVPRRIDGEGFHAWLRAFVRHAGEHFLRLKAIVRPHDGQRALVVHGVRHVLYPPEILRGPAPDEGALVIIARELSEDFVEALQTALTRFGADAPARVYEARPS